MNMKPILFNTDMVRAILANRKTVTRRVVKPQHLCVLDSPYHKEHPETPDKVLIEKLCEPPYHPGDTLYVRETWAAWSRTEGIPPALYYKADADTPNGIKWHPSIHMPREAARVFLKVTGVRVERLQETCGQGLIDEGLFSLDELRCGMMRDKFSAFEKLWNITIKPADRALYGWEANPYVWVIEFERISREEAEKSHANRT